MRWVNRHARRSERIFWGSLPILLLVLLYLFIAAQRHAANPLDKILPLPGSMATAMAALLFQPDPLTGQLVFWADTLASVIQQQLSNLSGISNTGSSTATNLGSLGQSNANAQSGLLTSNGSAQAGGILGSTGALSSGLTSGLGSALNSIGQYSQLKNTWGGMGYGLGSSLPAGYDSVDWGATGAGGGIF